MDILLDLLATAGPTGGIIGIALLILFFIRKQEAGVRSDINGSLHRLTAENADLRIELAEKKAEIEDLEDKLDELRTARREAEDRELQQRRRADAYLHQLGELDA